MWRRIIVTSNVKDMPIQVTLKIGILSMLIFSGLAVAVEDENFG